MLHRNKKRTQPRSFGLRGGGQTMLQQQRKSTMMVTPQQRAHPRAQQQTQQQQRSQQLQQPQRQQEQSSISMAEGMYLASKVYEHIAIPSVPTIVHSGPHSHISTALLATVMADLRILDEQQRDSQRKLESARTTKQRRVEQHGALQAKLRESKYQQGQSRAELQRIHQQLSHAQRSALTTNRVKKSGDNLRRFDQQLQQALATKRRLHAHARICRAKKSHLQQQVAMLQSLPQVAAQQCRAAQEECREWQAKEAALRQSLREKTVAWQRCTEATAEVRAETARLEQALDGILQQATQQQQQIPALRQTLETMQQQHNQSAEELRQRIVTQTNVLRNDLEPRIKSEQQAIADGTSELRKVQAQIRQIQVDEKHVLPSSEPQELELDLIRASEDAEVQAVRDEEAANQTLQATIATLRKQLQAAQSEEQDVAAKAHKSTESLEEAKRSEEGRRTEYLGFIQELESAKAQVETLRRSTLEQEKNNERRVAELQKEVGGLRMTIFKAKAEVESNQQKIVDTDGAIQKAADTFEATKKKDQDKLQKAQRKLASRQKKYTKLVAEIETKERQLEQAEQMETPDVNSDDLPAVDKIKAEIAQLYDGRSAIYLLGIIS